MQTDEMVSTPSDLGLSQEKLDELMARIKQEVDEGLLPAVQIAIARHGKLALFETYGEANNDSLFCMFSATKAITSAAAWLLIQEGKLDISMRVSEIIPEFAENDKGDITIEQLFLHTSGFPHAPFRGEDWTNGRRLERFSEWRLNWEPGTRYEYHPTSSMWIIAELVERLSGENYADFVRNRIALPLGLPDLFVGTPDDQHDRIADISYVGSELTEQDYKDLGLPVPPVTEVTEEAIMKYNLPEVRRVPVPGGGGITSAADLALFYQGLIGHLDQKLWSPETINMVTQPRTGDFIDPTNGAPINRGIGIVISGDKQRNHRGFGHTNTSTAFGHNGAGGQIAWVEPESGLSFAYLTNGHDRNPIRQARRVISVSNRAAVCVAD